MGDFQGEIKSEASATARSLSNIVQQELKDQLLEDDFSGEQYYMVTIKATFGEYIQKCRKNSLFLIEMVVKWLSNNRFEQNYNSLEYDTSGLVHYHGIIKTTKDTCKPIRYKSLQVKGFHIYIKPLKMYVDRLKAKNYIEKCKNNSLDDYMFI